VFDDGIGYRYDIGRDRMRGHCEGRRLVSFQRDRFIFGEVVEGDFVVGASQQDILVVLVDIDDVGVLIRVVLGHELK